MQPAFRIQSVPHLRRLHSFIPSRAMR
jgi:hypothetical protein